jgi:hypothetical protein
LPEGAQEGAGCHCGSWLVGWLFIGCVWSRGN